MSDRDPFSLRGSVSVVSAGCGGLGLVVAKQLAALGSRVVATSRSAERVASFNTAGEVEGVTAALCDFSPAGAEAVVREVVVAHGRLDHLVNVAGGRFKQVPPEQTTPDDMLNEFNASVVQNLAISQAAAANEAAGLKSIVNVSSIYGSLAVDHRIYVDPSRQSSLAYACAKAGLEQMTRYLAAYWASRGIRVNAVAPGGIRRNQDGEFLAKYAARVPMARMAEPSEVAAAIAYLCSPASSYVTGEVMMLDGGLHVW